MSRRILNSIRNYLGINRILNETYNCMYNNKRDILIDHILHDSELGISKERYTTHNIIVSLTTYGKRINDVALTIESIMQQTMKANKIILWLDYSFQNNTLPQSLINLQSRGLEIDYCYDMLSYKKIIPSLKKYPNDAIITIDDDLLYDFDILEHLILAYKQHPEMIHSCRGHQMRKSDDKKLCKYNDWKYEVKELGVVTNYFFTSGAGTLFPPHIFDSEVLNDKVFMDICRYADDIWLNAMALYNDVNVNKVYTRNVKGRDFMVNMQMQDIGLNKKNTEGMMLNDRQLSAVFERYNLYNKIK